MLVRFWGVRGSVASPGPDTAQVGGNTSSVEVTCGDTRIVFDAGTGLRGLGRELVERGERAKMTLLLSHYHWDHIQGLPFFAPVYDKRSELTIVGGKSGVMTVGEALRHQMMAPVFPVPLEGVGARLSTREVDHDDSFYVDEVRVRVARGDHPGGVVAYRLDHGGASVVYATDIESRGRIDDGLRSLAEGADILIFDAQYAPEEYPSKVGWGHSTFVEGAELARAAGVGTYVLYHHDPSRTDAAVALFEERARAHFAKSVAAREGLVLGPSGIVASPRDRSAA